MHILQLLPRLEVGGVERGVVDLSAGLVRRGHRVSVVSSGGALIEPLLRAGAMHYTLPVHEKSLTSIWRCIPAVAQLIHETGVDLVHARSRVPGWIGYAAARRRQVPFITTCHGFYRPHVASRVMTWGRTIIVPSEALGRYLIDQFNVPSERLRVIPRGVDLAMFQRAALRPAPTKEPWRIGLVGRMTPLKGHEVAVRALEQLVRQGLRVKLCFLGDAPAGKPQLRQELEQLAKALHVDGAIEWLGTRHDVPAFMASCDVVVAPSVYPESFGRTIIEAQAVGRPVVASRLGGFAEVIEDGVTGLLAKPADSVDLAGAINRLLHNDPLRERIVEAARARVERRYTLEAMTEQTEAVYRDTLGRPRVVVWKLSALGDVVLASPSLRAIRRRYSSSRITLVTGAAVYDLVARCPYVDEVVVYHPDKKDRGLMGQLRFAQRLRRMSFDVSIDLQNSRTTRLMAWLADISVRIGYNRRGGRLLTHPVPLPSVPMSPVAHQAELLRGAGIPLDDESLELWPAPEDEQRVDQLLDEARYDPAKPLVGVHPGGSARWQTKRWDVARWAEVCDRLAAKGYQVIITGDPSEQGLGHELLGLVHTTPIVAIGKTKLLQLACLIRRCHVFLCHDSAPLHLAAAVGTPTVALFGPTDPARHVNPSPKIAIVRKPVFCSPCYSPSCRTITHQCMKLISVDDVMQALAGLPQPPVPGRAASREKATRVSKPRRPRAAPAANGPKPRRTSRARSKPAAPTDREAAPTSQPAQPDA